VAIVGAGLAGLRAAHWLWTVKGIRCTVHEASTRLGGRVWTLRDYFANGQHVEHGGAFINTDHNALRNLVNTLGLSLYDVAGGAQPPYGDVYWASGDLYTYAQASDDWATVWRAFKDALATAPYPQTAFANTAEGRRLDWMSVDQWIEDTIPGGLASRFGQIMQSNAIAEYGLDPGDQSALNLIYLLGWNSQNSLDPINGADERFAVVGGNDQIIHRLADELPPGTIQLGQELVALRANSNGSATLTFQEGRRTITRTADRCILALPFTTLRDVDLTDAGLSPRKRRAIDTLGLGANGKLHVQLDRRPWLDQRLGGVAYSPIDSFQCLWDDTVNQPGSAGGPVTASTPGILCAFPGGSATLSGWKGADFGPAPQSQVATMLAQVEPIFPGVTAAHNGLAYRDAWHLNRWSRGAYTCPRPGQYTEHFGIPELVEGPFHFAGEHTSSEYFGFLNGAVVSGERAAKEVAQA
jgi:monoamine oxidase